MRLLKYFALFVSFFSAPAFAYLTIGESGDVLAPGKYQIGSELQLLTNHGGGANVNVYFDTPINDAMSARLLIGGGAVDFNAFGSVKFVPFPDVDNQPAIGIRVGAGVARDESENIVQLQAAPLASKRVPTEHGLMTPYIAVPFTYLNYKSSNEMASNIAFGTEFYSVDLNNVMLGAELGIELNKSYSYISIFASIPFDAKTGFGK